VKKHIEAQEIITPLAHHTNGKRMIVCTPDIMEGRKKQKIKGKLLPAQTYIIKTLDNQTNVLPLLGEMSTKETEGFLSHVKDNDKAVSSRLLIRIHKGRRHQIRAHLASIDIPII
jgi:hypothetical protein